MVRYITRNSVETVSVKYPLHLRSQWFDSVALTFLSYVQYIQCRQSKKLYLARLGWDADEDKTEEAKLKKLAVSRIYPQSHTADTTKQDLKSLLSLENGTEPPAVAQNGPVECEMADAP